ncbi:hypothetical protein [Xylanimonas protaetiae]|uniref:Uncharacterized protein n=1 Tax=Xylanimonas protaetiae TaxID=2509457 RepID=A0A4P6F2A9_9MICO|nr:hypothetical protein [Xylanimonas protaetiae]QAY69960.1 hypothetical protein ET471_07885 [Xylanimonas protaetiae]
MTQSSYRVLHGTVLAGAVGGTLAYLFGSTPAAFALWGLAVAGAVVVAVTGVRTGLAQAVRRPRATAAGVIATPAAPAPLDAVLAALDDLNDPDLPFEIGAEPTPDGAVVTVRWRVEELRWKTLFTQGSYVTNWKMVVRLDAARARYRFLEYTSQARHEEGVWPPRADWDWKGTVGKTAGQMTLHVVMTPAGSVGTTTQGLDGPRTSWVGAVSIRPADAKVPVLTTLRNHGWRPRADWAGARLFER